MSSPPQPRLPSARPARRRSLPVETADQLIQLIAAGTSAELALPSERLLSEQLEVSRNVLREALAALEGLGVVELHGKTRTGIVARARAQMVARAPIVDLEREMVLDPMEVRLIVEPESAALAAARATDDAIAEIERWVTMMADGIARSERVVDYDAAFHVAVAGASSNHTLGQLVAALNEAVRQSREQSFEPPDAATNALQDHRAILDAIRAGDPAGARMAMREHLERVEVLIREALREQSGAQVAGPAPHDSDSVS